MPAVAMVRTKPSELTAHTLGLRLVYLTGLVDAPPTAARITLRFGAHPIGVAGVNRVIACAAGAIEMITLTCAAGDARSLPDSSAVMEQIPAESTNTVPLAASTAQTVGVLLP